jgi:predicted transposase/invertase (TIGR01784 family)
MFEPIVKYDVQETRRIARAEGIAEGKAEGKAETARNLKSKSMPLEDIAEVTGLSIVEIENL